MEYKQVKFIPVPYNASLAELLIARLSDMEYEAFYEEEDSFTAYIPANLFKAGKLSDLLEEPAFLHTSIQTEVSDIPDINWNEQWEKAYEPIVIGKICAILAPHHPDQGTEYTIRIEPKMSFGTGHHETTRLMIQQIYQSDVRNKTILDMGSGTGVLGIFALKRGASFLSFVDIDDWAYTNSKENIRVNQIDESLCEIIKGDASSIPGRKYDIVLANINRNILLEDMNMYISRLNEGGLLILSGLLVSDREVILEKASEEGISFLNEKCENNWISLKFRK